LTARQAAGRRYARLATDVAVRWPWLWRVVRPLLRWEFDLLAPRWDDMRGADAFAPLEAALARVEPPPPARALDLGTGTGTGALAIARLFPDAEVVGADLSEPMIEQARRKVAAGDAARVRFEVADASKLPYPDGSFDLVTLSNMIPFFDELARVVAPGGAVAISFSAGPETPIYVGSQRLQTELERRGFADFAEFSAGPGTALLARKGRPA
jgi:ubiquinone/menaquinone biosynthesis C-methylase UbiE